MKELREVSVNIGRQLKKMRLEKGITQSQAAEALGLVVSAYQMLEAGERGLYLVRAELTTKILTELFGQDIGQIIEREVELHGNKIAS